MHARTMSLRIFLVLLTFALSNGIEFVDDTKINSSPKNARLIDGTFTTRLDHFRPQSIYQITFNYQLNSDHFQTNGPIYIYVKDVRDHTSRWIEMGLMVDIAAETRGALFTFNQRYLVNNRPTPNVTFENLEFLTVEQSLADIAIFIQFIRSSSDIYRNSKVILWGSGYGGTISTYARMKYPHLVDGVWSSSGIFSIDEYSYAQYDFLEHIIGSVASYQCSDLVRQAFAVIEKFIQDGEGEYLQNAFNLCHPIDTNSMLDIAAFYESHIRDITVLINRHHSHGLLNFCRHMQFIPGDPFNSFVRWLDFTYGSPNCFDHSFNGMVERTSNVIWDTVATNTSRRQWYYFQCTQIGSFLIADESSYLPVPIPIDYHIAKCEQVLGEQYRSELLAPAVESLIQQFGDSPNRVSNVIFTNGAIDPWLHTGMLVTTDPRSIAITIPAYSKSADLTSTSPVQDTRLLVEAKQLIRNQIIEWSFD